MILRHRGHVSFAVKGVIKVLIAIITIVLFLRVPQRMMQENSFIFACFARNFSGLWATKGMGSYWVKSSLARVKACWHIADLQETLWTSLGNKLMVKPLPPSFQSCGTWGTCKMELIPKSLLMQSLVSAGKYNLVFLRKEMVMFSFDINWHKYMLLQKFTSAMTLLQGSHVFDCTVILFYGTGCKWIRGSFHQIIPSKKVIWDAFMDWYLCVLLESETKLSTGFGGISCQNGGQSNCLFMLILNQHFEMLKSLNPRHNNKYVVWTTLKRLFPWNLIKSYIVYKTKPRLVGGRKIHSGNISKRLSLAELKLLHWNHSNGIFWLCNKVA